MTNDIFASMTSASDTGAGGLTNDGDVPVPFTYDVGDERIIRVSRTGAVTSFIHDMRYKGQIPGIELSIHCQSGCLLCAMGRVPSLVVLLPAVDLATLAQGIQRVVVDLKPNDNVDLTLPPKDRLKFALQNSKVGSQIARLCLFSNSPDVVTLRLLKVTEFKYVVLETRIESDMEPEPSVLADAVAAVVNAAETLKEQEGTILSAEALRCIPAIERALKIKGLA